MSGEPIEWTDVAIVAFDGDRPVILASPEPHVMFDTFLGLIEDDDENDVFGEPREDRSREIREMIESFRWELHPTEQAKKIFCDGYCREKQGRLFDAENST